MYEMHLALFFKAGCDKAATRVADFDKDIFVGDYFVGKFF
jgi:hypothetical protein